jgi:hypothetical protein
MIEENKDVRIPIIDKAFKAKIELSIIKEHLIIKKIPAVTIVAECKSAETGVGPSIASGNQECNPNWADLPTAAITKDIANISILLIFKKNKSVEVKSTSIRLNKR